MTSADAYFWQARIALQSERLNDSYECLSQAIRRLERPYLTLEQVELVWSIIPRMITDLTVAIERLVHYHRSMPIETDESFDRLAQSYVDQLEQDQANFCNETIELLDRYLLGEDDNGIDHINLRRLQADLYLHLSRVSRPHQCRIYFDRHRKLLADTQRIIDLYSNTASA